tara:strand:- start:1625 stop:2230 length:606 start_codon:yes stop_codon:yes gene_type:complete
MSDFVKEDFKRMKVKDVEFIFPYVDHLVHFKHNEKRTVECDENTNGANWKTSFTLEESRAKKLLKVAKQHFVDRCGKKEKFGAVHGFTDNEYQDKMQMRFTASLKGKTSAGKVNKPPAVVDNDGLPVQDRNFYNGSTGDIIFTMHPADNPKTGKKGISFILNKIVLQNPIYGGEADGEDLDETLSDNQNDDLYDLDDEIPF